MISPETLRFYQLFFNQDAETLKQIAMLAEKKEVKAGQQLFFEGEVAKNLFLVLDGSVVLTMNMGSKGDQKVQELEPLAKGEIVGWSSIVAPHIYKMGAYAAQDAHLIVFDGEKLRILFDNNPSYGYYFMKKMAEVIGERLISKCAQIISITD
ncbi:MAG: cyclic nucleotide-binding domain-containing protein [Anaerolineales bacterium]|nr:cyclic nucleotide-binding domain-containing protein [Anaerolineales bacterium]